MLELERVVLQQLYIFIIQVLDPVTIGNASATWSLGTSSTNFAIRENSSSSDYVTIDSSGNVGIGTDTPAKKLEIFGSGSENGILVKNDTNTNYRGYYIGSTESDNTAYGKLHMDITVVN